jgi:hypothetical protein
MIITEEPIQLFLATGWQDYFKVRELIFKEQPTTVYCDATAALQAFERQKCDSKLKQVVTRYHRTRQVFAFRAIKVVTVGTKENNIRRPGEDPIRKRVEGIFP